VPGLTQERAGRFAARCVGASLLSARCGARSKHGAASDRSTLRLLPSTLPRQVPARVASGPSTLPRQFQARCRVSSKHEFTNDCPVQCWAASGWVFATPPDTTNNRSRRPVSLSWSGREKLRSPDQPITVLCGL